MTYLGFRFTNKEYNFVILEGTFDTPRVIRKESVKFPRNFSRAKTLNWLFQELSTILSGRKFDAIYVKGMEPNASRNGLPATHRIENEGIVYLVAAANGIEIVERVVDATIAAKLKVGARDKRRLSHEVCSEMFTDLTDEKMRDAVLVAWIKMS